MPSREARSHYTGQLNASKRTPFEESQDEGRRPGGNLASPHHARSPAAHLGNGDSGISPHPRDLPSSLNCGEAESAIGIARKICELGSQYIDERTTSAIPGFQVSNNSSLHTSATNGHRVAISSVLGNPFPPMRLVYSLLEDYFDAVHWFSLAIYEPKFRKKLHSIADGCAYPSQRPFLVLLAIILGMAAWYRHQRGNADLDDNNDDHGRWSAELIRFVESNLVELMDQPSVTAAQTCILLGSHYVYHGRPNLSFSLLGATIKMSQSLGLHRQLGRGNFEDTEESKRVWWTIYTWDRFASITYGRPLGINDKDCNLEMPEDVLENPRFIAPAADQGNTVCYSTYQRELNRLYLLASPALKAVFGSRTFGNSEQLAGDTYFTLVKHATQDLQRWRCSLPNHLALDLKRDFRPDGTMRSRAYALQSLSLQLTYDNLLIVLHRPLIARKVHHLSTAKKGTTSDNEMNAPANHPTVPSLSSQGHSEPSFEDAFPDAGTASSKLWMEAAERTSKVIELPVLAQLATDSHLVAFLAINLFNAAIVLAVMAISEPLSDTAQEIKRTITRILRLQDLLGKRSALSKQSTAVLKNVITMLLNRESAAMLAPITGASQSTGHQASMQNTADPSSMSVEDTLRLPLNATLDSHYHSTGDQRWPGLSRADRLNESLTSVKHGKLRSEKCFEDFTDLGLFVLPVLGPGDDRSSDIPASGDGPQNREFAEQDIQQSGGWQLPAEPNWSLPAVPQATLEDSFQQTFDDGLYWLWDMTWNGVDQ